MEQRNNETTSSESIKQHGTKYSDKIQIESMSHVYVITVPEGEYSVTFSLSMTQPWHSLTVFNSKKLQYDCQILVL